MKKKRVKGDTGFRGALYVLITTLLLFTAVTLMIYTASSNRQAEEVVTEDLISYFDNVSREFTVRINTVDELLKTNSALFAANRTFSDDFYSEILLRGEENSWFEGNLYYIYESDTVISGGGGIQEEITTIKQLYEEFDKTNHYSVVEINGQPKLMICEPVADSAGTSYGTIIAFSDAENYENSIVQAGNKGSIYYSIIDTAGDILQCVSSNSYYEVKEGNLKTALDDTSLSATDKRAVFNNIKMKRNGYTEFSYNGHIHFLFYNYTDIGGLGTISIVDGDYVERLASGYADITDSLISGFVFAGIVFVIALVIIIIIDKRKTDKATKALLNQAETDQLTKLLNKVSTEDYIKEYLDNEGKDSLSALFVIDLDNFKKINDTLGHAFGDEVLRNLGHGLKSEFRVDDIVGRIGGDEFVIFLKNMKTIAAIQKEGERLEHFFKNFRVGEYVKYATTASIGAAVYPTDGMNFRELYMLADQALYHSKKKGKNRLSFYENNYAETPDAENAKTEEMPEATDVNAG